jgi:hypothetical protein
VFDFQGWIEYFREYYQQHGEIYNDAENMGSYDSPSYRVQVSSTGNWLWRVLGIHHLTPEENGGNHNVYIEVLRKRHEGEGHEREGSRAIHWTWVGRRNNQNAPDIFAGQKPLNELVNIPINLGQIVSVWPHLGETVSGLSSFHPDEGNGNAIGHHSFFICFQEVEENGQLPDPEPDPAPTPGTKATIQVKANLEWLNTLPLNSEGDITFTVNGE